MPDSNKLRTGGVIAVAAAMVVTIGSFFIPKKSVETESLTPEEPSSALVVDDMVEEHPDSPVLDISTIEIEGEKGDQSVDEPIALSEQEKLDLDLCEAKDTYQEFKVDHDKAMALAKIATGRNLNDLDPAELENLLDYGKNDYDPFISGGSRDYQSGVVLKKDGDGVVAYRIAADQKQRGLGVEFFQEYAGHTGGYPEEKIEFERIKIDEKMESYSGEKDRIAASPTLVSARAILENEDASRDLLEIDINPKYYMDRVGVEKGYEGVLNALERRVDRAYLDGAKENDADICQELGDKKRFIQRLEEEASIPSVDEALEARQQEIDLNVLIHDLAIGEADFNTLQEEEMELLQSTRSEFGTSEVSTQTFISFGVDVKVTDEGDVSVIRRFVEDDELRGTEVVMKEKLGSTAGYPDDIDGALNEGPQVEAEQGYASARYIELLNNLYDKPYERLNKELSTIDNNHEQGIQEAIEKEERMLGR